MSEATTEPQTSKTKDAKFAVYCAPCKVYHRKGACPLCKRSLLLG